MVAARPGKVLFRFERHDDDGHLDSVEYSETTACGKCGFDLDWIVRIGLVGQPPVKKAITTKTKGWLKTGGAWFYGPRARKRAARDALIDYTLWRRGYDQELPIYLHCPRCGERQVLDIQPRSQEVLEAAFLTTKAGQSDRKKGR
jgi:hypothetical protein